VLELDRRRHEVEVVGDVHRDGDVRPDAAAQQIDDAIDLGANLDRVPDRVRPAPDREHLLGQLGGALQRVPHGPHEGRRRVTFRRLGGTEVQRDHGQQVVEVMGQPRGQYADGVHPPRLLKLIFEPLLVGDVAHAEPDLADEPVADDARHVPFGRGAYTLRIEVIRPFVAQGVAVADEVPDVVLGTGITAREDHIEANADDQLQRRQAEYPYDRAVRLRQEAVLIDLVNLLVDVERRINRPAQLDASDALGAVVDEEPVALSEHVQFFLYALQLAWRRERHHYAGIRFAIARGIGVERSELRFGACNHRTPRFNAGNDGSVTCLPRLMPE
jgi:hypothetical protein